MIIIQKPTKENVRDIQQVFYETWLVTYPNKEVGITVEDIEEKFKDRLSQEKIQKRTKDILNMPENEIFLIAKDGDAIVGVCKAEKRETENELSAIYVLPSYQGKGVGMMLWEKVKEFFGNEKSIIVHVATYNTQAINFYQRLGFIDTGKRFTNEKHKMPISGVIIPEMELVIKNV